MLGATRAGKRLVAVGDRGLVILSDDDGKTYRQARTVPTRATLTAVWAADASHFFAVGHWGVILASADAGETWTLQRSDFSADQPLFSVWFKDARHGVAAGLFSLLLVTSNGGTTWDPVKMPAPLNNKGDLNLYKLFPGVDGDVWLAAEQGMVYRSKDLGQSWTAFPTGAKGTFWAGAVLPNGTVVVGGLTGRVMLSDDQGKTWHESESGTKSSITDMMAIPDVGLFAVALDGISLLSLDGGHTFRTAQLTDQRPLTALALKSDGKVAAYSQNGVVNDLIMPSAVAGK
ncbi:MAG: glycosyl hydrolase [Burkholderiaceae bacterium]|nr:glycosyl hydrolase [Burkholderiaceae bacterium]